MENLIITNKINRLKKSLFPRFKDFWIIFLVFFLLTFLVSVIVTGIYLLKHGGVTKGLDMIDFSEILKPLVQYTYVIPMVLTIAVTLLVYKIRPKNTFKPVQARLFPLILFMGLLLMVILDGIMQLVPGSNEALEKLLKDLVQQHFITAFLVLAVAAPLLEEYLFRGIILKYLLHKTTPWRAIMISSLAFALFHLNIWQGIGAFIMGMFFGYLYWRTGSLFYPVLLHFMNNALATLMMAVKNENLEDFASMTGIQQPAGKIVFYLIAVILFVLMFRYLDKQFRLRVGKTLYLSSNNPHKFKEIQAILPEAFELKRLSDLSKSIALKETGNTLEDNSLQKAFQVAKRFGVNVIADDTGLEVEALGGAPGVYSARYAGSNAGAEENRRKLLAEMKDKTDRNARFRTVITLIDGNDWRQFEGEVRGYVAEEEKGTGGFGYDSIFVPEGYDQTFAEMSEEEKNRISHRARALEKLVGYLSKKQK